MGFSSMRVRPKLILAMAPVVFAASPVLGQKDAPAVVRPGAPGQQTTSLAPTTRAKVPPGSAKDVEFMQGMIMHHAQAVEMVAMIAARTGNKAMTLLGNRISQSQSDEMAFMRRWL